jgi:hypothetical protein
VSVILLCVRSAVSGFSRTLFAQQQPPQPAFKSSVEVTSLDVTVVDTTASRSRT